MSSPRKRRNPENDADKTPTKTKKVSGPVVSVTPAQSAAAQNLEASLQAHQKAYANLSWADMSMEADGVEERVVTIETTVETTVTTTSGDSSAQRNRKARTPKRNADGGKPK